MRNFNISLYTFEELNEQAQAKAIETNHDINVDFDWWESTYEDAETVGLKITSFEIERKISTGEFTVNAAYAYIQIIKNHGTECNTHKLAVEFEIKKAKLLKTFAESEMCDLVLEAKENVIDTWFAARLKEAYLKILSKECEYLMTDEAIKNALIANEYEFTKDGDIFNAEKY